MRIIQTMEPQVEGKVDENHPESTNARYIVDVAQSVNIHMTQQLY